MKSVQTAAPEAIRVVDIDRRPLPGPDDVLVRIRACGICGTVASHIARGGLPFGPGGALVAAYLSHEPAGEVADVGANVAGLTAGDPVVVNPMASRGSLILSAIMVGWAVLISSTTRTLLPRPAVFRVVWPPSVMGRVGCCCRGGSTMRCGCCRVGGWSWARRSPRRSCVRCLRRPAWRLR